MDWKLENVCSKEEQKMWKSVQDQTAADAGPARSDELQEHGGTDAGRQQMLEKIQSVSDQKCELQMIALLQETLERLSREELRRKKGTLVRDYNHCQKRRQQKKDQLTELLNQMARREIFAEDFYRKPIEAMLSLTDHAGQVLRQLVTTLQSYENLMEKIQVDIAIVEEEKSRIAELFGEYVHEVHQNLSRIDQNSTITIRDKNVRMLKITLSDWEKMKVCIRPESGILWRRLRRKESSCQSVTKIRRSIWACVLRPKISMMS